MSDNPEQGDRYSELDGALTMTPEQWIGALANAWWLGHRDVCNDCNCRDDSNPYHLRRPVSATPTVRP